MMTNIKSIKTIKADPEWPDEYPMRLRKISWKLDGTDGTICGPHKYYNKHLPYNMKGDSCFVKQVLLDWFYKNGCCQDVCDDICQYFCKCFSVYYVEGEGEFRVTFKKDADKQIIFDQKTWCKMWGGADMKDAISMRDRMMEAVKKFYDNMMK